MGTTEKFRPVPWGLTVLPLEGSDIVIASIDNEYQVSQTFCVLSAHTRLPAILLALWFRTALKTS